jgi:hypothetical protein
MQIVAARKRKERLRELAEAHKLLVPAGFPRLTRDYRLGLPDGELALVPDPASIPTSDHAVTDFTVTFFPEIGIPADVTDWDDERWLEFLRKRIADLQKNG